MTAPVIQEVHDECFRKSGNRFSGEKHGKRED